MTRCFACAVLFATAACGSDADFPAEPEESATSGERLHVGTGEYDPTRNWHAILRFDDAMAIDGERAPDATIPILDTAAADGTVLNFAHGLYLDEGRDEMYVASLFTHEAPLTMASPEIEAGSIGIIAGASSADGPQTLARHIWGDATGIDQPHGVWRDEARDLLYVANTFGQNVLVFANASSADGDVAPVRTIWHSKIGSPVFVYLDETSDRLFTASMNTSPGPAMPPRPAITILDGASSRDGESEPDVVIAGPSTRLEEGNNQTTHNVWYDASRGLLLVGHHTNELLIFDLAGIELDPAAPAEHDLAPRVLQVHEQADGSDIGRWSVYGLFLLADRDRLYVSCGRADAGPTPGSPPNVVKVYDGLLDSAASGLIPPSRTIAWTSGEQYFPPQPLWVSAP